MQERISREQLDQAFDARFERAVAWLKSVQRSEIKPNLPVMEDADGDGKPDPAAGEYIFGSNPKRSQHF